jgi:predicted flavoprotein YhiN
MGISDVGPANDSYPLAHAHGVLIDVTRWLGGYNFQWAWASGHAAGQVA